MGNLLFSPNGSINTAEFMRAGLILIAIGVLIGVAGYLLPQSAKLIGYLPLLLLYPWAVIWIKRLRDGGKSGWMFLLYLLIYFVLFMIAFMILGGSEIFKFAMEATSEGMGEAEMNTKMEAMSQSLHVPMMIVGGFISLVMLYIGDKTIPRGVDEE